MSKFIECVCSKCESKFQVYAWELKRRKRIYCSQTCFHKAQVGHRSYHADPVEERICVVCAAKFLVGGRGRPPKKQRMCSDECQRASRYRHGAKCNALSDIDAAYLAGFLDGEGSIMLYERHGVALKVTFSNTNKSVLQWIAEITGIGSLLTKDRTPDRHKISHWWQANADAAESLLKQIRPYLKIKSAQADLAIETRERLRNPALKADRSWHESYRLKMQALNRRGPEAGG